jgi:hypothetical protein
MGRIRFQRRFGQHAVTSGGGFMGRFVPIQTWDVIRGAYLYETGSSIVSKIRFRGIAVGSLNAMGAAHSEGRDDRGRLPRLDALP